MKFQPYEILSTILPGYIFYALLAKLIPQSQLDFEVLSSIAIAYLLGYLLNIIASLLEPIYFFLWGGKPSRNLLSGSGIAKVKFTEWEQTKAYLLKDYHGVIPLEEKQKTDALFNVALRESSNVKNSRIADFNANYALSRTLFTCLLCILPIGIYVYLHSDLKWLLPFILIALFLVGIRARQRGYYFAKEVLNTYLMTRTNQ